jgi:hypothetical protein
MCSGRMVAHPATARHCNLFRRLAMPLKYKDWPKRKKEEHRAYYLNQRRERSKTKVYRYKDRKGLSVSREFNAWYQMLQRCTNPNHPAWYKYGGRGIKVCKRWFEFDSFFVDLGQCPSNYTLHRLNDDEDYEPENCRWGSRVEQGEARRNRRRKLFRGYWVFYKQTFITTGVAISGCLSWG